MAKIAQFKTNEHRNLDRLQKQQEQDTESFGSLLNQMDLKLNNGKPLTEEDVMSVLNGIGTLKAGSEVILKQMDDCGLADKEEMDGVWQNAWKDAREKETGLRIVK